MKASLLFLSLLLLGSASLAADCGLQGTLPQRIQDCNLSKQDKLGNNWALVTRLTGRRTYKVWLDGKNNRLWTGILTMSQDSALKTCAKDVSSELTGKLSANWKVSSVADYQFLQSTAATLSVLRPDNTIGSFDTFWTDVRDTMYDFTTSKTRGNASMNAMPLVCTAAP